MRACATGLIVLCAWVGLVLPHLPGAAEAAPVIKVRARTEIVLEPVRRGWRGVEVRGQVLDRFGGAPVPFVDVGVRMSGVSRTVRSDRDGVFIVVFDVPDGRYDITLAYDGDDYFDASTFEVSGVDVRKQNLELSVRAGDVAYNKRTVEVVVQAMDGGSGAAITADLYAGTTGGPLEYIDKVTTDSDGRGTAHVDRERLSAPGRKRIQVRFLGSRAFNPAEAQIDFLLTSDTQTTLSVHSGDIEYESALAGAGRVVDDTGQGVAHAPVALMVGSRRIAQALTDEHGAFRLRASGSEIGAGKFHVQAVFEPSQPWHRSSRSELVPVQVAEPQPVPVTYTLAAFGATALAMVAFLGLRTRPWQAWLARLRRQDRGGDAPAQEAPASAPELQHGLALARPGLVSTLRRPHEHDFSGTVRDAVRARAVPGALVALTHPDAPVRRVISDRSGAFALAGLEPGEWSASVSADGYVTERFTVTMPHRGELRGARVDLVPVREKIFELYRDVAQPLLPHPDHWGIWTPRQIFDHVRRERPTPALSRLTDFVEEAYFSQRTPGEAVIEDARALVEVARHELTSTPPAPDAGADA